MEEKRLCITMLQGFCSLALVFVISSAGYFVHSDEITFIRLKKVCKSLQRVNVVPTTAIKVGKDFTGFF